MCFLLACPSGEAKWAEATRVCLRLKLTCFSLEARQAVRRETARYCRRAAKIHPTAPWWRCRLCSASPTPPRLQVPLNCQRRGTSWHRKPGEDWIRRLWYRLTPPFQRVRLPAVCVFHFNTWPWLEKQWRASPMTDLLVTEGTGTTVLHTGERWLTKTSLKQSKN